MAGSTSTDDCVRLGLESAEIGGAEYAATLTRVSDSAGGLVTRRSLALEAQSDDGSGVAGLIQDVVDELAGPRRRHIEL